MILVVCYLLTANHVKLGRIMNTTSHPITPRIQEKLLQEARDLFAKENQFNSEGKDIQNMAFFNSLVKPLVPETDESTDKESLSTNAPGSNTKKANESNSRNKSSRCVLS